jgi:succinate dehydrogenase / fumarate reductase iron-sulfur subunit
MEKEIKILRKRRGEKNSYWQSFMYSSDSENDTVATALKRLNNSERLIDIGGRETSKIQWQCSCLQKKCGACAMRINKVPRLACDTVLKDIKEKVVVLEPLKKFPVIEDLIVDRSIMFENLKRLKIWLNEEAANDGTEDAYEASRCLQCGCCLEVCPNFISDGKFAGMSAGTLTARLLSECSDAQKKEISDIYKKNIYAGCGKSLSCYGICPAGIDIEHLLVKSNAIAVWKHRR